MTRTKRRMIDDNMHMLVDYTLRCEKISFAPNVPAYWTIRYGMSAKEAGEKWEDVASEYMELSQGGKVPEAKKNAKETVKPKQKHFFTEELARDQVIKRGRPRSNISSGRPKSANTVQSYRDAARIGTSDDRGSASIAEKAEARDRSIGSDCAGKVIPYRIGDRVRRAGSANTEVGTVLGIEYGAIVTVMFEGRTERSFWDIYEKAWPTVAAEE
jgi:hypothetical protein